MGGRLEDVRPRSVPSRDGSLETAEHVEELAESAQGSVSNESVRSEGREEKEGADEEEIPVERIVDAPTKAKSHNKTHKYWHNLMLQEV